MSVGFFILLKSKILTSGLIITYGLLVLRVSVHAKHPVVNLFVLLCFGT